MRLIRQSESRSRGTAAPADSRQKLAIITTVWRYLSHAQHMGDRFLVGYPLAGKVAPARDRRGRALRRPEADGRPERRASPQLRLHGLSDHRSRHSGAEARGWPSTAS